MTAILAIDPGPASSAWLYYADGRPVRFAIESNADVLARLRDEPNLDEPVLVIEKVESFGMAVGAEVFETVFWSGRFAEAYESRGRRVERLGRMKVKTTLCHDSRAKDANIRQALIDRFGGAVAIGRKASPGPLHGISNDVWSALAIAVTFAELEEAA